jgi:hypothetical protein
MFHSFLVRRRTGSSEGIGRYQGRGQREAQWRGTETGCTKTLGDE